MGDNETPPCPVSYAYNNEVLRCTFGHAGAHDRVGPGGKNKTLFDHGDGDAWWNNDSRYVVIDHQPEGFPNTAVSMGAIVADVSRWIDNSPRNRMNTFTENLLLRTTVKIGEEHGELDQALIGMLGQNPRKQTVHTLEDVEKELLDVAFTALGAVEHLHRNDGSSMTRMARHIVRVANRMITSQNEAAARQAEFQSLLVQPQVPVPKSLMTLLEDPSTPSERHPLADAGREGDTDG